MHLVDSATSVAHAIYICDVTIAKMKVELRPFRPNSAVPTPRRRGCQFGHFWPNAAAARIVQRGWRKEHLQKKVAIRQRQLRVNVQAIVSSRSCVARLCRFWNVTILQCRITIRNGCFHIGRVLFLVYDDFPQVWFSEFWRGFVFFMKNQKIKKN